ncbi:MAG: hypothetical protein ACXAEU_15905 [Candidatus Hodarchaeales archaeon]
MVLNRVFLIRLEEKLGPFVAATTSPFDEIDDSQLFRLVNKLFIKAGMGNELPPAELGGPVMENEFPSSKLLYFPITLEDPKAKDPRVKQYGSLSVIYLEFTEKDFSEDVLQSFDEIQATLYDLVSSLTTVDELEDIFPVIKSEVESCLQRAELRQLLSDFLKDSAVEGVIVVDNEGEKKIVIKRDTEKQLLRDPILEYDSTVIMSSLVISGKLIAELEDSQAQDAMYVNYEKNRVRLAVKIEEGYFFAFLDRSSADLMGLDHFLAKVREAAGLSSFYFRKKRFKKGIFSIVREHFPDVHSTLLVSKEGEPLLSEDIEMVSDGYEESKLAGIAAALMNMIALSSINQEQELLIVYGHKWHTLIIELPRDRILLFKVPKTRPVGECLIKIKTIKEQIGKKHPSSRFSNKSFGGKPSVAKKVN